MTDAFADLANALRWLTWREEMRNGRWTKVPYVAGRGGYASATDPATWRTRSEAEDYSPLFLNGHAGSIGVVLGDIGSDVHLCGIDLDSCLHDGLIEDWAAAILDSVASYAEVSPSGQGIKCWFYIISGHVRPFLDRIGVAADAWGCRRSIGPASQDHGPAFELYVNARYFTVTGQHWARTPEHIAQIDDAALAALAALIPPRSAAAGAVGGDDSRSARAFRAATQLKRQSCSSYGELRGALLGHADSEVSTWAFTKGLANDERELRRLWERAGDQAAGDSDPVTQLVDEFNAKYMVVNENGKAVIYAPRHDPILNRRFFDRMSFEDFKNLYQSTASKLSGAGRRQV